ncbi:hypothetical protein [Dactylosporangium sp. NPDC048998]|uniref:hypothetical protein n=1 Tax=Dactylosporangium sp. NPDC048998 TaxID=3363976 RepID=UPI0037227FF6
MTPTNVTLPGRQHVNTAVAMAAHARDVGGKVTIGLPSGRSTKGTITAVGVPTEKEGSNGKTVVIPVVVALADPAAAGPLQQATVTVNVPSAVRENLLSRSRCWNCLTTWRSWSSNGSANLDSVPRQQRDSR